MVSKKDKRDTYKYHLIKGNRILYRGITTDLDRRLREHQQEFPRTRIRQIGRRTTREKALEWEHKGGKG